MNSHARRLVDGDDVFVFVEDFQRDEFGFRGDGGPFRDFKGTFFAAAKMHGAFQGRLAVYADLAGVDEYPHTRSTSFWTLRVNKTVKALAGSRRGCDDFAMNG